MKTSVIGTIVASLLAGAAGLWFGFHIQNPPITWDVAVMVTCGGGDYPKEAFRKVNDEIASKMNDLFTDSDSERCFVAVVPEISGYRIRIAGDSDSSVMNEAKRKVLSDWIHERMEQIQREESQAEQAGAGQPATRPESNSEGSDKPQPESEGRSR